MKINIEIDCMPDEARLFFGLLPPNSNPCRKPLMARIERQMSTWRPPCRPMDHEDGVQFILQNPDQLRDAFTRSLAEPFGPLPGGRSGLR